MRKTISQLNMLTFDEYNKVINEFNSTSVDYSKDKCVCHLFERQASKTPDRTAVIASDQTLTYSELNSQANRIAHSLIEAGIRSNDIIAFMLSRKSYLLSVMFGIIKSGACYLPIDPDYPQDRINYMLHDSGAKLCITDDNIIQLLSNKNSNNPNVKVTTENFCYCIYTSGSTGNPKGTLLTQNNVVNYCNNSELYLQNKNFSEAIKSVKVIMLGGEILNQNIVKQLKIISNCKIFNGYGPTETTLGISFGEIE